MIEEFIVAATHDYNENKNKSIEIDILPSPLVTKDIILMMYLCCYLTYILLLVNVA